MAAFLLGGRRLTCVKAGLRSRRHTDAMQKQTTTVNVGPRMLGHARRIG